MLAVRVCAAALGCAGWILCSSTVAAQTSIDVVLRDGVISPSQISATTGQTVTIRAVNSGTKVHNLIIPDFYVFSNNLNPGENVTLSFKPDKTGRFSYYSDAGRPRGNPEPGMTGTLHVR